MPSLTTRHKKSVSVTLEPALLQQARDAGLDLSAVLTAALIQEISSTGVERWKTGNRVGLQELNRITDEYGLLSDEYIAF
ncbi:type II toxin-antitoxin system CcdA family antitoxin [Acerihabitans sp. KWT182]|uniref:Type II toxin-antitoxin system CcdA family antitoxin n=1 Tax=Acerihabitans sp. KWT182 TaxID=3157919 RepID=A0AAU7QAK7_9GAMM